MPVKSNILSFRRHEIEPMGAEILVCELLPSNSRKLTICVCYRPPDFSNFNTIFELLLVNLFKDGSDRSRLYFLGDFNYPNINWQTNTTIEDSGIATDFCQLINSYFLSQLVDEPTRYNSNRASILDLLLCNYPDDVSDLSIAQDILDSDHLGISFRILTKVSRLRQVKRVIYNFKSANFDGLREALSDISWDDCFLDSDNINNSLEKWTKLFYSIVDQFVQKKCVSNINRSPWVDREIVLLLKKKNTLRRKAKSRNTDYLWSKFRRLRAEIKKLIKYKKKVYISNLGQDLKSNPKRFWSFYKALNKTNRIPNTILYGNITVTDSISKANIFNTFFILLLMPVMTVYHRFHIR